MTLSDGIGQVRDSLETTAVFPFRKAFLLFRGLIGVFCVCEIGFYFIAKSSPLPVAEEEAAHLTYGVMMDVLKGKGSRFLCALLSKY